MSVSQAEPAAIRQGDESFASWLYRKAEKQYNRANQLVMNVYGIYSVANEFTKLAPPIHTGAKVISYFGLFDLFFAAPRLVNTISTFCQAKDFWSRVNAMIMTASEVNNLYNQFVFVVDGLKELKILKAESFAWTQHVSNIFLPLQVIFMGQSIEQTRSIIDLKWRFHDQYRTLSHNASVADRVQNIARGLIFVEEQAETLQSSLLLSKKCRLLERARQLQQRIDQAPADKSELIRESEEFLGIMENRLTTRTVMEVANTVISVVSTVFGIIGVFIPANPICATVYAITTVNSIVLSVADAFFLEKNPFEPSPNKWQRRFTTVCDTMGTFWHDHCFSHLRQLIAT